MKLFLVLIGVLFASTSFAISDVDMLKRADKYLPIVSKLIEEYWYNIPMPEMIPGQVEQESTWKETATLKTSRELGRGFAQITIAYDKEGKERFNNFRNAVKIKELSKWNWKQDPYNVEYQLTYLILTDKGNFALVRKFMKNDYGAWMVTAVCYNAGYGRIMTRRATAKAKGLPDNVWHGGLEQAYSSGENVIIYNKPLWKMVNEYPELVYKKSQKYKGKLKHK